MKRRDFLAGASALGLAPLYGHAATELHVGGTRIDTLSDGYLTLPKSFIVGDLPAAQVDPILAAHGIQGDMIEPPCNVTMLRSNDRVILFDVGSGPDFMPSAGALLDALDAQGVAPEDVTHVIFTHAHPDHLWGVLDDFDDPLFPEAQHLIGRKERDYWLDPNTVDTIGEARAAFAVGAARRLEAITDQLEVFDDGQEIVPGVMAHASYGHTPGHMAFEITTENGPAMVLGDAVVNHHLALAHPEWPSGSDQNPEAGIAARMRLLDQVTADQIPVIGFHLPNGGLGRIEKHDGAYRFIDTL